MINADERYTEYVKNCTKKPRSFGNWLLVTLKLEFHRDIIRPQIIWWQNTRKEQNLSNWKYNR